MEFISDNNNIKRLEHKFRCDFQLKCKYHDEKFRTLNQNTTHPFSPTEFAYFRKEDRAVQIVFIRLLIHYLPGKYVLGENVLMKYLSSTINIILMNIL